VANRDISVSYMDARIDLTPSDSSAGGIPALKDAICENQAEYIQFSHCAHQRHKRLRIAAGKGNDQNNLVALINGLTEFLNRKLRRAILKNFAHLENIFRAKHAHAADARICTKGLIFGRRDSDGGFVEDPTGLEFVFDLVRYKSTYSNAPFPITENTGFEKVARDGDYYLEQDIPRAAKHRKYKNSRLKDDSVAVYEAPLWEWFPRSIRRSKQDYRWQSCWEGYEEPKGTRTSADASYKSTYNSNYAMEQSAR
jgi:hypothetical protein